VIRYTNKEETQTIDEIVHPSVREWLKYMGIERGVEIVHTGDIPAMSGIGSSSSFTKPFAECPAACRGDEGMPCGEGYKGDAKAPLSSEAMGLPWPAQSKAAPKMPRGSPRGGSLNDIVKRYWHILLAAGVGLIAASKC